MNLAIQSRLNKVQCQPRQDYENALKEIIQEIALLGLWRAKFFEHASFYGGTALRILYGLDRFSENIDFSLLEPQRNFELHDTRRSIELARRKVFEPRHRARQERHPSIHQRPSGCSSLVK